MDTADNLCKLIKTTLTPQTSAYNAEPIFVIYIYILNNILIISLNLHHK